MKILGAVLKSKRKELNLSIQEVADKLNVAYGTAANMESGGKKPTLTQLDNYGLIFGCDGMDLIDFALDVSKDMYEEADSKFKELDMNERSELFEYCKEINNEYKERKANENVKMNSDIDAVIKILLIRWTTKDTRPVEQRELTDVRNEAIEIITMRLKHLLY